MAERAAGAAMRWWYFKPYQDRVREWVLACFGQDIANDPIERSFRFLEEALELTQALHLTRAQAHTLVDYVFDRPTGLINQEVGGTMVTLAALCGTVGIDMVTEGELELSRVHVPDVMAKIRRKQQMKRGIISHAGQASLPGAWNGE